MRHVLLIATAAFALTSQLARAEGEGAGDPFPFHAPGIVTRTAGLKALPPGLDDPYPFKTPGQVVSQEQSGRVVAAGGSEGGVQSLNSLPAGFGNGVVGYAQARPASPTATVQAAHAGNHS